MVGDVLSLTIFINHGLTKVGLGLVVSWIWNDMHVATKQFVLLPHLNVFIFFHVKREARLA